jgi:transcriptional regulator with XRE-family HTH domain
LARSKAERSEFAKVLSRLLDETGVHTREEWQELLQVTQPALSQWVNDRNLPRPEILRAIVAEVRNSNSEHASPIITIFEEMSAKPASEVSPLFERRAYRGMTVANYLLIPVWRQLQEQVGRLAPDKQEEVLQQALALCPGRTK